MAVDRKTPTTTTHPSPPGVGGAAYADAVNEEVAALWSRVAVWLTSVSGTDTITASADPALDAYARPQAYWLVPANTNGGAATLNIDGKGAVDIVTASGGALPAGALVAGRAALIVYDGSDFRLIASGAGDTVGPAGGVVDSELALYNGTTGKALKGAGGIAIASGRLTGLSSPSSSGDAATKGYVDGLIANVGKRARVRAASTANVAVSNGLENGDALDGVTLATGDLVLLKDQSAPAENGIYVVSASGAASRFAEFDTYDEHPGSLVAVQEGSTSADTLWICTSNAGGTLDTTAIAFARIRIDIAIPVTIAQGGTNATTASAARTNLEAETLGEKSGYNAQTGTTYTFVLADKGKLVTLANASPVTLTVPPNADVAFPVGTQIDIAQYGDGQVTIAPGSGVTLNSSGGKLKLFGKFSGASLVKTDTNTWLVVGDLTT